MSAEIDIINLNKYKKVAEAENILQDGIKTLIELFNNKNRECKINSIEQKSYISKINKLKDENYKLLMENKSLKKLNENLKLENLDLKNMIEGIKGKITFMDSKIKTINEDYGVNQTKLNKGIPFNHSFNKIQLRKKVNNCMTDKTKKKNNVLNTNINLNNRTGRNLDNGALKKTESNLSHKYLLIKNKIIKDANNSISKNTFSFNKINRNKNSSFDKLKLYTNDDIQLNKKDDKSKFYFNNLNSLSYKIFAQNDEQNDVNFEKIQKNKKISEMNNFLSRCKFSLDQQNYEELLNTFQDYKNDLITEKGIIEKSHSLIKNNRELINKFDEIIGNNYHQ